MNFLSQPKDGNIDPDFFKKNSLNKK